VIIANLLILTQGIAYASTPISDGFDYPVGIPDGAGYNHDAGWDFLENEGPQNNNIIHPGEDWNGNNGGDTDLGDPVYAISNGRIIVAANYGKG
jgi:hypothetical protein